MSCRTVPLALPFEWECSVSMLRNPIIRNQLALAIGVPFGLLTGALVVFKAWHALWLVAATLALAWVLVLWLNGGRYNVVFRVDAQGITCSYSDRQIKKNQWVNGLVLMAGLAKAEFGAAGAGMLASTRQRELLRWRQIRSFAARDAHRVIVLKAGLGSRMVVFAPASCYPQIKALIQARVRDPHEEQAK